MSHYKQEAIFFQGSPKDLKSKTYFLAGCQKKDQDTVVTTFMDCDCIGDNSGSAFRQRCDNKCEYFILFAVGVFLFIFLHFGIQTPTTMAVLKCVKKDQKSLALGLKRIIVGLLGSLPGPILFGYFIDQTCIFWINGKYKSAAIFGDLFLAFIASTYGY